MWIGTPDGLYKYNGYSFTKFTYNPIDTTSLANTDVSDIKEDKEGRILVAAGNSFCIYSREKNNFKNYNYSLSKSKGLTAKMIRVKIFWVYNQLLTNQHEKKLKFV